MKKNCFVKLLCVNLAICMAVPNLSFVQAAINANHVYAAEPESGTEPTSAEELETEEIKMTQVSEIENEMTQVSEINTTDNAATETMSETETETESIAETEITTETVEETEEVSATQVQETETAPESEETQYISILLEKLKKKYSNMYINDDGYFEYTDENGVVNVYDPYDPELCKNLLEDDMVSNEYDYEINQYNNNDFNSTVSPFTKKTYLHEDHVSNKIIRHGIDVSKYQGNIDWEKAKKAGVYFAFVRVGYRGYSDTGTIAGDDYAKINIKKAYDAGVKVGIYFFSQAITKPEASEEAEFCLNFLKNNNLEEYISLPIMIDYEYSSGDVKGRLEKANLPKSRHQEICDRFVNDVRNRGYKGGIYANYGMLKNDMQPTASTAYDVTNYWIARYNEATHYSDNYKFWQYSSNGKADGISGRVDCNFWYEDKRNIADCRVSIDVETDYVDDIKEALSIYDSSNRYELIEGKDYEVKVSGKTVDGKTVYSLVINGINQYEGKVERHNITMTQLRLSEAMVSDIEPQEYTGLEITQETGLKLKINNGNVTLSEGKDYTVSYSDNIRAGTGYVIVTGKGNYTGEIRKSFQITGMKLTEEMFEKIPNQTYTGYELKTDTGVIISGTNKNIDYRLVEEIDYTLKYSANRDVGQAKVTVVGKGNYAGELPLTFQIVSKDFSDTAVVKIGSSQDTYEVTHTGKALKPSVTVMINGENLSRNDYTVEYGNNVNVGTDAYVLVKGRRNYAGEVKKYFTILPKASKQTKLTGNMVSLKNTHLYTAGGEPVHPALYVVSGTRLLEKDVDYTVFYRDNKGLQLSEITDAGIYKAVVNGIGDYTGTVTKNLTLISEEDKALNDSLTEVTLVSETEHPVYTGKAVTPQIKVVDKVNGEELVAGKDYKASYIDNKAAGTARIVIKGKGSYKGETVKTFDILPKNLGNLKQDILGEPVFDNGTTVKFSQYTYIYNGRKQQPKLTVKDGKTTLKENRDFKVTYDSVNDMENASVCINADQYTAEITFQGNYAGTAKIHYKIVPADLNQIKVKIKNQLYTGNSIYPELDIMEIKLGSTKLDVRAMEGVSFDNWNHNMAVGTAGFCMTATQNAKNFVGNTKKEVTFKITKKPIKDKELSITVGGFTVSEKNKCDLELVYNDGFEYNQSNGAKVVVTDSGTGVTLKENQDYTVSFSNNKNAGNAKVKISGIGGYSGTRTITFKIIGKALNDKCRIELSKDGYIYNQSEHKPAVKVYFDNTLLKSGKDYTIKYQNNLNAGEATVIVTGKGKYAGTVTEKFTITPKQAKNASKITVSNIADQKYTGEVIVPKVMVTVDGAKLDKGKDYTVSVLNSTRLTDFSDKKKSKGIATMIITGIGNYQGTLAKKSFIVYRNN